MSQWVREHTYLPIVEGSSLYLATVIDCCTSSWADQACAVSGLAVDSWQSA